MTVIDHFLGFTRPDWMEQGACRGAPPEEFVPDSAMRSRRGPGMNRQSPAFAPALALCATCHVQSQCLAFALAYPNSVGVWGNHIIEMGRIVG